MQQKALTVITGVERLPFLWVGVSGGFEECMKREGRGNNEGIT
jgi:hypothetical protein